jgi:hypothetical protein
VICADKTQLEQIPRRVNAIVNAAKKFYWGLEIYWAQKDAALSGLPPCLQMDCHIPANNLNALI